MENESRVMMSEDLQEIVDSSELPLNGSSICTLLFYNEKNDQFFCILKGFQKNANRIKFTISCQLQSFISSHMLSEINEKVYSAISLECGIINKNISLHNFYLKSTKLRDVDYNTQICICDITFKRREEEHT